MRTPDRCFGVSNARKPVDRVVLSVFQWERMFISCPQVIDVAAAHCVSSSCRVRTVASNTTNNQPKVCRDPLANSFIAPLTADPAQDGRLVTEEFERSAEDDAEFGIDHLKLHDTQRGAEDAADQS
jgi:hypothetical protein